ncbi:MAG TPA: D-glucuronyl C5-epimerase family protein [Gaiellaceae bacterium]|nr:D-glucuronyl C5-epimerase family protein [Gaiellaceae bacterium]
MDAGFFSSAKRLRLLPGRQVDRSRLRGYYIDFHPKTLSDATWPPTWLQAGYGYVKLAQVALGHFERYVSTGDADALHFADSAAAFFVATQQPPGSADEGGWYHGFPYVHRAQLAPPWLSAMAQGQAASLLLRVYLETGREELADSALLAMRPFDRRVEQGGVTSVIGSSLFAEEYPTTPASHVLNGAVFALWGVRDVAETLQDTSVRRLHDDLFDGLVSTLPRFDLGTWSRYDLYPKPPVNIASSFYHRLHITQLEALASLYGDPVFATVAEHFVSYEQRATLRIAAFVRKVAFRLRVPRPKLEVPSGTTSAGPNTLKVSEPRPIRRP